MTNPRPIAVVASDGYRLAGTIIEPSGPGRALVVLAPATGVARHFYHRFLGAVAAHGHVTLTLDYRGVGESRPASLRGFNATIRQWATLDLVALIQWGRAHHPTLPVVMIGHSFGGQAIGLVAKEPVPAAVVLIGAQHGYYGHWSGARRFAFQGLVTVAIPALTAVVGYLPGRAVGMGENLPTGVAREWASWCRSPTYLTTFDGHRALETALFSLTAADDGFAPAPAVEALLAEYARARVTKRMVKPSELGLKAIGHFGYFRSSAQPLWDELLGWIDQALEEPIGD